jgi:hypothetical protein
MGLTHHLDYPPALLPDKSKLKLTPHSEIFYAASQYQSPKIRVKVFQRNPYLPA